MKKRLFGVFFFVLALQLLTVNVYALNTMDTFMGKYNDARYMQYMMDSKVNWAVKLIAEKGEKAFPELEEFDKTSGIDIFVYDPQAKKMVVAPDYVSVVDGKLEVKDVNPDFFSKEIIKKTMEDLTSDSLNNFASVFAPYDFKNHIGKVALTQSGKVYIVATGLKNISIAKEFIVSLVNSACQLIKNEGAEAAFKEFNTEGSIYRKNNTYVYVFTDKGDWLVDPNYPDIVGKNMYNYAGPNNTYPVQKFIKAVANPPYSSWIYTQSLEPTKDKDAKSRIDLDKEGKDLKDKLSFLKKVTIDGKAYIVGSGVYIEDAGK